MLLSSFLAIGQVAMISMRLDDCISCRRGLQYLDVKQTGIPTFCVFKESDKVDSIEISARSQVDELDFNIIFNNHLYERFKSEGSRFYLIGETGEILLNSDLKKIDQSFVKDSIMKAVNYRPYDYNIYYEFTKNRMYEFSTGKSVVKVYGKNRGKLLGKINSLNLPLGILENNLNKDEAIRYKRFSDQVQKKNDELFPLLYKYSSRC